MKKWIGWIGFFVVVILLAVGGFFLLPLFQGETFSFKEVEVLDYNDYTLNDLVEQDVICNSKGCKFKDKDVIFTISEAKTLGKQDIDLKIEYEGETFQKTFHVNVVDRVAPEILLSEKALIVDKNEKIDPSSYITSVKDNYDELNIEDIVVENNVDLKNAGDYEIVYTIKDSSNNEGKTILKVKVKGDRETITSSDNQGKTEEVKEDKVTLDFSVSGLFSESGTLMEGKNVNASTKNIELGWDLTLKATAKIDTSGSIRYIISKNKITGNELTPIGGRGFPVIGRDEVTANKSSNFEYTFTDEGTYYFSIVVLDQDNEIVMKKDFVLNLSIPDEVKDMKMYTTDKGSYMIIDCDFIGGGDNSYYFVVLLTDSDDPKALEEELIVNEEDEIRLYYTSGYYYELMGCLVTEEEDIVFTKTLKVQK